MESTNEKVGNSTSLLRENIKRSIHFGKAYLIIGLIVCLSGSVGGIYNRGASQIISQEFLLIAPIFVVLGSLGSLMVFVSDKDRGVYEYLIAYGDDTSSIFWSVMISTVVLVSITLGAILVGVVGLSITNSALFSNFAFLKLLLVYTIPLSYTSSLFVTISGMIWTFLTVRRSAISSSPVGAAPVIGMLPAFLVFLMSDIFGYSNVNLLAGIVSMTLLIIVLLIFVFASKKLTRERFLSNA